MARNNSFYQSIIYALSNIINASIPFLLLPVLTRYLTPSEYGLIAMFQAVVALSGAFTGISLHGAIRVQYFKKKKIEFSIFVGVCLVLLSLTSLLSISAVFLLEDFVVNFAGTEFSLLLLAVVASAVGFLNLVRLVLWQVKEKPINYGVFQILQTALNACASLYLVLAIGLGAEGRIYGIAGASIIFGIIALATMLRSKEVLFKWNKADAKSAMIFGVPLIPHVFMGIGVSMADRFILGSKIDMAAVGVYFVAVQLALPISVLADGINKAFMPWSFKNMADENNIKVVSASYLMMAFFILVSLVYLVTIYFSYEYIVGGDFKSGINISMVLIVAACFSALYYPVVKGVFYSEKTVYLSAITTVLGVAYVISTIMVIDDYGMLGLAVTFLIYQFLLFISVWILANKLYPQPWLDFNSIGNESKKFIRQFNNIFKSKLLSKK